MDVEKKKKRIGAIMYSYIEYTKYHVVCQKGLQCQLIKHEKKERSYNRIHLFAEQWEEIWHADHAHLLQNLVDRWIIDLAELFRIPHNLLVQVPKVWNVSDVSGVRSRCVTWRCWDFDWKRN